MDTLNITWEYSSGEKCVWEIEHMFGFDVYFGHITEGRYIPLRFVGRDTPLPQEAKDALRRYICRWSCDHYASLAWACEEAARP
jgi:hypothetical protein